MSTPHPRALALVLGALLLTPLPLGAASISRPGRARMARALHLTADQQAAIQAIRDKHKPELVAHRQAAREAGTALRTALRDPLMPEDRLRALHEKASSARFDLLLARRALRRDVEATLTPEQIARAAELRGLVRARRRERMRHLRMAFGQGG